MKMRIQETETKLHVVYLEHANNNRPQRYYIWKRTQSHLQSQIWTDPHGYFFCNIVTVLPSHQGMGIGKMLFQKVTDQADREGRRCYLESSRAEPNVKIYERLGFRMVSEMDCDDDGVVCKVCREICYFECEEMLIASSCFA